MATLIEPVRNGEVLLHEVVGITRDTVPLAANQTIVPGQLLGRLTSTGAYVAWDPAANTGAEIVAGVAYEGVTTGGSAGSIVAVLAPAAVKEDLLVFPQSATPTQIAAAKAALRNLGIRVRAGV
jgi:hypothetical protein